MGEAKEQNIIIRIEATFRDMIEKVADQSNATLSGYVRKLIIEDLRTKGLVDADLLMKVVR